MTAYPHTECPDDTKDRDFSFLGKGEREVGKKI